jgi:hypothetical protein
VANVDEAPVWRFERRAWSGADWLAIAAWTVAIAAFFWKAVSLQEALFYFDITEINYPYRDFFARELRAGRFSRWHPGLYCGLPLFCESQAGYLHPLKYLLYPWLATWQAFNLDTILSIWLTGLGTYGWLRRHVGASGALTGAACFGLSGYVWAHLIHTSMINALTSVPLLFWALESAWEGVRLRPVALGALAMACQVFAGHAQDTISTAGALGLYTVYRAATEHGIRDRLRTLGLAAGLVGIASLVAAVQWIPSKELLDRSPRARGLDWDDMTYGSWHPELIPTLIVREAYGTRARDTDWMDGFYPYHEMNVYMGVIAMALAIVGGRACRDRWVGFWVILTGVGGILMLGRFTFLFDKAYLIPVVGSSRVPVRFHLWVALAVSALAAVGVDRLSRPGPVRLRGALLAIGGLILVSIPILIYVYTPVWSEPNRWHFPNHLARFRWLGRELMVATARTAALAGLGWGVARRAARTGSPRSRARLAAVLPCLVIADLLGAHGTDVPTITPEYWTSPPASARYLRADPTCLRVQGIADKSAGEPGHASEPIDFMSIRDSLSWSLPPVWDLSASSGITPMYARRHLAFTDGVGSRRERFDLQGVTHLLTGHDLRGYFGPSVAVGAASIYRNSTALPRARMMGRPVYVAGESDATATVDRIGPEMRHRLVVEDPDRPLPADAEVVGKAAIVREEAERVEVTTDASTDAYLALADTFDPGWSATVDGRPAPIRPAWITFRAVFVPRGRHTVVFGYRPAGFEVGLTMSACGLVVALICIGWPRHGSPLGAEHRPLSCSSYWPCWGLLILGLILVASTWDLQPDGIAIQRRWARSMHRFTWGSGIESMRTKRPDRPAQGRGGSDRTDAGGLHSGR